MNKAILCGHLGADPDLRFTSNGEPVLQLRLATNESWLDKNGKKCERTDWHSVVVWGKRAEALTKIVTKGMCILVEGQNRTSSYEKDGIKRYKTEVVARDIQLLGGGRHAPERDEPAAPPADIDDPGDRDDVDF